MTNTLTAQASWSLDDWLSWLEQLHNKPIELGLERVASVAARLDVMHPTATVFTVGGTNGKGTTCRMLESILLAAGYRVGVYSSPHLEHYTERVRIQGEQLTTKAHCAAFARVEAQRGDTSLTYFEYGTLAALWLFQQARLDVMILEIGLGGRLDACNIIDSDVAVITSIALDHTDWLGNDRDSIGREKAGIFRAGKPAVVGEPDMPASVIAAAKATGACLLAGGISWHYRQYDEGQWGLPVDDRQTHQQRIAEIPRAGWCFVDQQGELAGLPLPHIPLANAATSLAALRASGLTVSRQSIEQGLKSATLPGRFQIAGQHPRLILDVAHNPHAAAWLAQRVQSLANGGRVLAVVGMLADKDIAGTLANLATVVDSWFFTSLASPRGAAAEQLASCLTHKASSSDESAALSSTAFTTARSTSCSASAVSSAISSTTSSTTSSTSAPSTATLPTTPDLTTWHTPADAVQAAMQQARENDTVLVCGSFYTVAAVLAILPRWQEITDLTEKTDGE